MDIFKIEHEFIDKAITKGLNAVNGVISDEPIDDEVVLRKLYFIGQGLCLDITCGDNKDVITVSHSGTYGLFSGGLRRNLSLRNLVNLEKLMKKSGVNYEPNEILKNIC